MTPATRLRPRLHLVDSLAQNALLDHLALAVQRLELLCEQRRLAIVLGQQQPERGFWTAEPTGGVDPRREPQADRLLVEGCGIDAADAHQRPQPWFLRLREAAQSKQCKRAVLVDERDDVGNSRGRDD